MIKALRDILKMAREIFPGTQVIYLGRHPKLVIPGRRLRYPVPATPSDVRSVRNIRSDLLQIQKGTMQ